jgi:hypothetical protein
MVGKVVEKTLSLKMGPLHLHLLTVISVCHFQYFNNVTFGILF